MHPKADVLLIQPPYPGLAFETTNIPLGLAWISAVLEGDGFTTCGYDLQVEGMDLNKLGARIEIVQPKLVGVQFHGQVSFDYSMDVVKFIKTTYPDLEVITGGQQATFRPRPIIEEGRADFVVLGEGEFVMRDLVRYHLDSAPSLKLESIPSLLYRTNGAVLNTERAPRIDDLDTIPLPNRDAFDWKMYPQWVIMTSRGCPYRCAFCSSSSFWGREVRFRSAESVVEEIQQLVDKYEVDSFLILDDTFSLNKPRLERICREIISRKLPVTWGCGTRTDHVNQRMLSLLKQAGCVTISFGLESANPSTLSLIDKDVTLEQQKDGILMSKKAGFQTRVSVMLGLPGESPTEVRKTLDFLLETEPNEIQLYPIMPYDGTAFHSQMDELGISICDHNYRKWSKDSLAPIAETKWLSREQIVAMAEEIVERLAEHGYTHMTGSEEVGKQQLDKVVSTGLTPFQLVDSFKGGKNPWQNSYS